MKNWTALKNEWTAIIVAHHDDYDRLQSQIDRLVERWDGVMEDTGGGNMVGFVWLDRDTCATVNDESIHVWIGREPFSDDVGDEFFGIDEVIA